ncbi:sulfotransferase [Ruegeria sp. HKCCA6948]|uniref:sulfotransferase n=1 Tax=Ruegeria sp. HKCCA6948 TaxID=2682997 RepID=UPI001489B8FB|nr:sulfotransferase [Ruegeria sp. HKCCA6948]
MDLIVLGICGLVVAELLMRLPLVASVRTITATAGKAVQTVSSKSISDHWKERVLPIYALRMGLTSIKAFAWLLLAFSPFLLLDLVWPGEAENGMMARLLDWRVMLGLTVLCGGYASLRARASRYSDAAAGVNSDYSALDRFLHKMVLGVPFVSEMVHDIERGAFLKSAPDISGQPHVFIAGLARAGTTVLLRDLHLTGQFGTLTYSDMPFVLAPNLWSRLRGQSDPGALRERAHGDGIQVNAESPEAFDEVYWRVQDGEAYIRPDRLLLHTPSSDVVSGFTDYMALILKRRGKTRYLSKNNNNILRLETLTLAYPAAHFLVPIRDPLQHANSLLRQHRRFADCDAFTADYMDWLGHHEFGRTHRPFVFDTPPDGDPNTMDYWLQVWIDAYRHISRISAENLTVVEIEKLATDPSVQRKLAKKLDLPMLDMTEMRPIPRKEVEPVDQDLVAEAMRIFNALRSVDGF